MTTTIHYATTDNARCVCPASGMIGAELVAKSAPGHTLLLGNIASLAINVGIYPKMPYDR